MHIINDDNFVLGLGNGYICLYNGDFETEFII